MIVDLSVNYIKAEIWPASFALKIDHERASFGKIIDYFKQYATIEYNRDILLDYLVKYKKKRNEVVHKLFDIADMEHLAAELDNYSLLADEILKLLIEYDNQVCEKFCDLERRVNFNVL